MSNGKNYKKILVKGSYDEIPQPKGEFVDLFKKYNMIPVDKSVNNSDLSTSDKGSDYSDTKDGD